MKNITKSISRRDFASLIGAGAASLAAGSAMNASAASHAHDHSHHKVDDDLMTLIDESLHCMKLGEICDQHALELFKKGDTTLGECSQLVKEMLISCEALYKMSTAKSDRVPALAKFCLGPLADAEKECRKYEKKHVECKNCAEACKTCIKACKNKSIVSGIEY